MRQNSYDKKSESRELYFIYKIFNTPPLKMRVAGLARFERAAGEASCWSVCKLRDGFNFVRSAGDLATFALQLQVQPGSSNVAHRLKCANAHSNR